MRKWIVGILVAALASACGFAFVPPERLLMNEAKKITSVNNGGSSPYFWRSADTALLMPYDADGDGFKLVELDADTGLQKPLDGLNNKYRADLRARTFQLLRVIPSNVQLPLRTQHDPPGCTLSPDGQSLILAPTPITRDDPTPITFIGIALNGTNETRWHSWDWGNAPLWLRDSHRWIETVYTADHTEVLMLHDTQKADQNERISIPGTAGMGFIGITHSERVLAVKGNLGKAVASVQMADYAFTSPTAPPHKYSVYLPKLASVRAVALSTKGDRLAWLFLYEGTPPLSRWIHRLLPSFASRPQPMLALWVSDIDGKSMMEIGHKAALPEVQEDAEIANLQWLPGDKKLSFLYSGSLYAVPVP